MTNPFRKPSPDKTAQMYEDIDKLLLFADKITDGAAELYDLIDTLVPPGREQSLAKTKLQECVMWSLKAISEEENN
jgi:hypothetical protein